MTLQRWRDRLTVALRPSSPAEPGGLPFSDLYPTLRPVGIRSRAYPPVRFVAASTRSTLLAIANPARVALEIVNDGAGNLYLAAGAAATTTSYTAKLPAGALFAFEDPDVYQGDIYGVWDVASGAARITEQT